MKKYIIRVNCPGFKDIEVRADSLEEAIEEAEIEFQCDQPRGEFCEVIYPEKESNK